MKLGEQVADFALPVTDEGGGGVFRLSVAARARRAVVLYFYPKDDTPGCTLESGEFSALLDEFHALDAEALGVSRDDIASHQRFRGKFNYRHHLLADVDGALCRQFGVLREAAENGRPAGGIIRCTFLIDRDGKLAREWRNVQPAGHAAEVLAAVRALPSHPTPSR